MNTKNLLFEIGLSKGEVDVYLICLKDFYKASEVAKIVNQKRTNVYAILESLIKKGLIIEVTDIKVKRFRSVSISRLYDYVEKMKINAVNNSKKLDNILEFINQDFKIKRHANTEFYNGFEEVYKLILDQVKDAGTKEVKEITKFERYAIVGDIIDKANNISEKAFKRLNNKYIREKVIVPDNDQSRGIIEFQSSKHKYYKSWHDFRMVDFQKYAIDSQITITQYDIVIISITESETWAIRFLDKSIVKTFNALFDALWINAKIYK